MILKNKSFTIILCAILCILVLGSGFACVSAYEGESLNTDVENMKITVMGEASEYVDPDCARVYMTIQNVDLDVNVSKSATLDMYQNAVNKLAELEIPKNNIDMSYFSTYPSYDYSKNKTLVGYYAVLNFNFKVDNIENVNNIIDEMYQLGITNINHINYEISETNEVYNSLLEKAVVNAENKAKLLLQKDEVSLVNLVEENSYNCTSIYRSYADSSINADLSSQIKLTARVQASFM